MKKMYAARGPSIALRDVGEGIPKEVTFELRSEGCIGNKQRGPDKTYYKRNSRGKKALVLEETADGCGEARQAG